MSDRAETEVNELPDGWEFLPLKEAAQVILGQSPSSDSYNEEGNGLAFFQGKAEFGQIYPTVRKWCTAPKKVAEKDDVLVSVRAPVGPTNLAPSKCAIGRGLAALRPLGEGDSRYFLYLIRRFQDDLAALGTGTTFEAISGDILKNFEVPIAPPKQQKQIVAKIEELFSHIDSGIDSLKKAKELLKQYRQSVLKAAVTGELTREWREANKDKLEPAADLLDRILKERRRKWEEQQLQKFKAKGKPPKNNNWKGKYKEPTPPDTESLPFTPEGWVWATLPQLGELNRGKSKHRPRNASFLYGGEYPFVQTGDIKAARGWLRQYTQTYSEKGLHQSRLWPTGTLCITIAANIADTAILGMGACFPDSVVGFIPHDEDIDVEFVEFFIRTVKGDLELYAPATAQKNINLATLKLVSIPLPPKEEQKEIVSKLKTTLDIVEFLDVEINTITSLARKNMQSTLVTLFRYGLLIGPTTTISFG